jgi:SAM-dependent methyltransferase
MVQRATTFLSRAGSLRKHAVGSEHERIRAHFDERASGYSDKYRDPTSLLHFEKIRRLELLLDYARELQPSCVLDAGSGSGVALSALGARLPGARRVGVDLSLSMLQGASDLQEFPAVQALVEHPPFKNDSFDLVYALGVMDYVQDLPAFFRAARRILKPAGHFVFTYPNGDSVNRALRTWSSSLFARSRKGVAGVAIASASVDRLIEDFDFELLHRHFITYGSGFISFPWSAEVSRRMERRLSQRPFGRHLAWSCLCVVQNSRS